MDFVPLALLAVAVVGLGSAATVLLTRWIQPSVAVLAAQHGRFAGLGEQGGPATPRGVQADAHPVAHAQQEAMHVVRTSN